MGERQHGGAARSASRIAHVVTGQALPRCNRVIDRPQIPIAACRKDQQLAVAVIGVFGAATCGQYPYFLRARIQRGAFLATLAAS